MIQPRALSREERSRILAAFSVTLAHRDLIDAYWIPESRQIALRSVQTIDGRAIQAVPHSAVALGRFRRPYSAAQFVNDLDDVLAGIAA